MLGKSEQSLSNHLSGAIMLINLPPSCIFSLVLFCDATPRNTRPYLGSLQLRMEKRRQRLFPCWVFLEKSLRMLALCVSSHQSEGWIYLHQWKAIFRGSASSGSSNALWRGLGMPRAVTFAPWDHLREEHQMPRHIFSCLCAE